SRPISAPIASSGNTSCGMWPRTRHSHGTWRQACAPYSMPRAACEAGLSANGSTCRRSARPTAARIDLRRLHIRHQDKTREPAVTVQPTQKLAEFVAGLRFDDLPAAVRERTVEVLLDTVACAFLGSATREAAKIEVLAQAMGGAAGFTVIAGRPQALVGAVLVNGYRAAIGSASA